MEVEKNRRCLSSLHPHLFNQKTTALWEFLCIPLHHAAALSSFIQTFQLTQEARLLILFNNSDCKTQKKTNVLPPLGASSSDPLQPDQGISGIQRGLVPREVANENRSKTVKCITVPKKMEWDFPTLGFISRKWINIILRGHFALTR